MNLQKIRLRKENTLFYTTIILLIMSLIRLEILSLFAFSLGLLLGSLNKIEKWVLLK